jgi:hypothetical protein
VLTRRDLRVAQVRSLHHPPCGHSSVVEPLSSKQKTRVRFSLPAPHMPRSSNWPGHRSFKSGNAGSSPARGANALPLRLDGRAPDFESGRLGSNPRGAAIETWAASESDVARHMQQRGIAQLVERGFHTPRQPQVRFLLPRPGFCRLSQVGRQRVVAPSLHRGESPVLMPQAARGEIALPKTPRADGRSS